MTFEEIEKIIKKKMVESDPVALISSVAEMSEEEKIHEEDFKVLSYERIKQKDNERVVIEVWCDKSILSHPWIFMPCFRTFVPEDFPELEAIPLQLYRTRK